MIDIHHNGSIYIHDNVYEQKKQFPTLKHEIGQLLFFKFWRNVPEIIYDVNNGFLFDHRNINDLVDTLVKAIELVLSGESEKMRTNAQKRIFSFANLKENMNKRLALIDKHFI